MNNQFDELTKTMAQTVTRRTALKKCGLASIALACFVLAARGQCLTPLILWESDNSLPLALFDPHVNNEDPDGDGVPNILEWAFNLPPNIPGRPILNPGTGTNGLPFVTCFPGNPTNVFTVEYIRNPDAPASGVTYEVQTATALTGPWIAATNGEVATSIPGSNYQRVVAGVQALPPAGTQQFCRVAVLVRPIYCPVTIYNVKQGYYVVDSPIEIANALITGMAADGFYLQIKESDFLYSGSDYSGVFVHTGTNSPNLNGLTAGLRVVVDALVASDSSRLFLDQVGSISLLTGVPEAAPVPVSVAASDIVQFGPRSTTLESVIVQLGPPSLTTVGTVTGQFTVSDGSTSTLVDDSLFTPVPAPLLGQTFSTVTGIYTVPGGSPRVEPRYSADLPP